MTENMGSTDRIIRFVIALVIAVAYFFGYITATWAVWTFGIIAAVMLATSLFGYCPLYSLFGISTKERTLSGR
jgi:hypothetical protein